MARKIYYLGTCSTCKKIMAEINLDGVEQREIKSQPISKYELAEMEERAGNVEALFSKRAQNYRKLGLQDKVLGAEEMRELILNDYTFLKRPVILTDEGIFIGNSAAVVEKAKAALE